MHRTLSLAAALCAMSASTALAAPDLLGVGSGRDGARTITTADTQINVYTGLSAAANAGAAQLNVASAAGIAAGDLVMVWQTQRPAAGGPMLGDATPLDLSAQGVGQWELVRVSAVANNALTLATPLVNAYLATGAQVIRVPEYTALTINQGASIAAKPWDGTSGGAVVALVRGEVANAGEVSASAAGFRGGTRVNDGSGNGCMALDELPPGGAPRGEGIIGNFALTLTGRGNLAQGAGGGVCLKSGGGGGGHIKQGGLGGRSAQSDGGRLVGGLGGQPLVYDPVERLTMGGGGGSGHAANNASTGGGIGGGLILVRAGSISGQGAWRADGASALSRGNDGQSGGGAGGAVILRTVDALSCGITSAQGGSGGSINAGNAPNGPGGGGAGGLVLRQFTTGMCPVAVECGLAGTQPNANATDGIHYGAQPSAATRAMCAGADTRGGGMIGLNVDADGDGIHDIFELGRDTNGNNVPDYLDPDDDGDGLPTRDEAPDPNGDGDPADARITADNLPDYLNPNFPGPIFVTIIAPADSAVTTDNTPTISGEATPFATIAIVLDGQTYTTQAAADGTWSFEPPATLVNGAYTATITATDGAGRSAMDTVMFTIDALVAQPVMLLTPAAGAVVSDATPLISGTAAPGATISVLIDGVAVGTTTADMNGAWSLSPATPLADGMHTVTAISVEQSGATSQQSGSFSVDTTAPVISLLTPQDGQTLMTNQPTITGTAEPGATVIVTVDGAPVATVIADMAGAWSAMLPAPLSDGQHIITASSTDGAGNTGSDAATITIETGAAILVAITSPAPGAATNDDTPTVTGTASPNATIVILVNGMMVGTVTADAMGAWSFTPPAAIMEGAVVITAQASDGQGNMASDSVGFEIDVTPPALSILSPADGATTNIEQPTIFGSADPGATVTITVNGQTATVTADANGDWSFVPAQPLPFGPVVITVSASDDAGNTSMDTATITVIDDMGALDLTIISPASGAMISTATPTLIGQTAPGATVEIFVDGVSVGTTTADALGVWTFVIPAASALSLGQHTLEARATSGQDTATVAISVTVVDPMVVPVVITAPAPDALTNDDTPTISGTAAPGATVEIFIDGVSVGTTTADMNGAWTIDAPMLGDGEHIIRAEAGGQESSVTVTVDTMAPVTTVTGPTTGGTVMTGTPVISGTGEPGSTVTIIIDGMEIGTVVVGQDGTWTFTPPTPLGEGEHTIVVIGEDEAGNSLELEPIVITVDEPGDMPMVGITSPAPGMTVTTATPTISGTANPGATVEIIVDGVVIGTVVADANGMWSFTPTTPLSEGDHTIEARVTIDGQTSNAGPLTVTIDVPGEEPEDSGMIVTGREGCATAPAGEAPAGGLGLLGALLGLIGWRRRR